MIDLDRMEEQLASALTERPGRARRSAPPAPAPAAPSPPPPAPSRRRRERPAAAAPLAPSPAPEPRPGSRAHPQPATAPELLEQGLLAEADAVIAAGAQPRDALTWATMRALFEGRQDASRTGVEELRRLAQRTEDAEAEARAWIQRFWVAVEWGTNEERIDVLQHCREQAYRFDDLTWWGHLTLLLALMGKSDEAVRAIDEAAALAAAVAQDARWLDAVTNLVEAAAVLGDAGRVASVSRSIRWPDGLLVVVGGGVVCKGSVDRYRALGFAATGKWAQAEECFRSAEATHRGLGAAVLLARTLEQASRTLVAA